MLGQIDAIVGSLVGGGPGWVVVLVYQLVRDRYSLQPRLAAVAAVATATARETDGVDGDRAAAEAEPDDRDVAALRTEGGDA